MTDTQHPPARQTGFWDRFHARLAARARPATGFVSQPEPRTIGHVARGRQLIAGNFLFSGVLTEAPGRSIWDMPSDNPVVLEELHGCAWLDDLAAVADARARERAQDWVFDWIARYGRGRGPGWTPALTGRRLIRWINHSIFLLRGQETAQSHAFFRSLGQQTIYLARRWKQTPHGLPRFEALTGLIYAGLALEGMEHRVDPAVRALAEDCKVEIDAAGGLASRNPEDLMEVFTLLHWAMQALQEAGKSVPPELAQAMGRAAPTLRALRHADGGLARFHGGGRGLDGRLDHALVISGIKTQPGRGLHMGYARLNAARCSLIVDASPPPQGQASHNGHASTLAFELTSGRRPLIVNCGSGRSFGEAWRRAGRATPSHSVLGIEGYSSSRLGAPSRLVTGRQELLVDTPDQVQCVETSLDDGIRLELAHNGFQMTHGLTHARVLDLGHDGRGLVGEDMLFALTQLDKSRFNRAYEATNGSGIPYTIRFHLHPDVDAELDLGGNAISMALKSGEIWVFRFSAEARLALDPSVYLENGRLKPRTSRQVVLSGRAMSYATRVRWSLTKAQETPDVVRDLAPSTLAVVDAD